jgi:DNA-binding NarL/FixJ family response regulator
MLSEIRVVIADDHPVLRHGLQQVIESDSRLKVVAQSSDGEAALAQIEQLKPQIAVLDIDMPGTGGLGVAREVQKRKLPVEIVFLTIHGEEDLFDAAMDLGAKGYLLKESALADIVRALCAVADGQHFITPSLTSYLVQRRQFGMAERQQPGLNDLTPAEKRILNLIANQKSSKQIAAELFVHHRTVENHRTNICQKLGLRGHNALFMFAISHKSEL